MLFLCLIYSVLVWGVDTILWTWNINILDTDHVIPACKCEDILMYMNRKAQPLVAWLYCKFLIYSHVYWFSRQNVMYEDIYNYIFHTNCSGCLIYIIINCTCRCILHKFYVLLSISKLEHKGILQTRCLCLQCEHKKVIFFSMNLEGESKRMKKRNEVSPPLKLRQI